MAIPVDAAARQPVSLQQVSTVCNHWQVHWDGMHPDFRNSRCEDADLHMKFEIANWPLDRASN
ncbi:MAG TPA: hypothetical protein VM553_02355 [Dongiaceae bacterium]|nr:hypothetical protein [Dongiaceae bacterium]